MNNRQNVPQSYDNPYEGYYDESYQPNYDMNGYEYDIDPNTGAPYPYGQVSKMDLLQQTVHLLNLHPQRNSYFNGQNGGSTLKQAGKQDKFQMTRLPWNY